MKPNPDPAKRAPFAIVFAVAALLALPIIAQAGHWPNFGGDAGRSGNQPVNEAELTITPKARLNDPQSGTSIKTTVVISGGDAATGRRFSYGSFVDVSGTESDENRVHIRDVETGAEKVAAADQIIENDGTTDDNDVFGPGDRFVTPVSSSTDGGLGQLFAVHNDTDNAAQTAQTCTPNNTTSSENDIAIAQFDEATGAKKKDVAVGAAQGRTISGESDPTCPTRTQVSNGFSVESSPVLTPPLDGGGRRILFFTGKGSGSTGRLFRVEIENAGSPDAVVKSDSPQTRDIPNLNTSVPPAIAFFEDQDLGYVVPFVIVAVNAAAGASDIRAFNAEDIVNDTEISGPIDIPGDPQSISIPTTEDGLLPGQIGSGEAKAPAMYAAYKDGEETRVHRFTQQGDDTKFTDAVPNPPALDGTPGVGMALSQVVSGGAEQAGRVIVSTAKNLFALNPNTLAPAERFRDADESLLEGGKNGFQRNAPMTSGGFVFIQSDGGIPQVLNLSDLERVDPADFTPESSHLQSDYGVGQPAYSDGNLVFTSDRGLFHYRTGVVIPPNEAPVARFVANPNPAAVNQQIVFDATTSSDPEGKGISKYEWDFDNNGTYEVDSGSDPKQAAAFPAAGTFTVGLRVTDVAPAEGAPVKTATTTGQVVINPPPPNKGPEATFTVTPNPAKVDQRVTFDASATKDPEGNALAKFEWDLDGNGTFETNSGTNPRVQRSYGKANIYNVKLRVTDDKGGSTEVLRQLAVTGSAERKSPRRLTAKVTPKRDAALPYDFRTTGTLTRPSGVSRANGCSGRVTVVVKVGKKTISRRTTALRSNCTYRTSVRFRDRERIGEENSLRFTARFQGNKALKAKQAKTVRVSLG